MYRGEAMTLDESQQTEELLIQWHRWQDSYRPALGGSRCDATCRGYQISNQLMTAAERAEQADRKIWEANSVQVDLCVDRLTWQQRAAVQTSMRNKRSGASVWSNARIPVEESHALYQDAKDLLFPMFDARGLIKPPFINNFAEGLVNSYESCQY